MVGVAVMVGVRVIVGVRLGRGVGVMLAIGVGRSVGVALGARVLASAPWQRWRPTPKQTRLAAWLSLLPWLAALAALDVNDLSHF